MIEIFRATIFHTPQNPFRLEMGDPRALISHDDGGLAVDGGRVVACGDYASIRSRNPEAHIIDWRGGFLLPGFVDTHTHFPQLRILGAMGRPLLDWLSTVALPEEARMADRQYAADTARLFLRALASHGTTTALVFGAHFAPATAALFDEALASRLRIASGLVVSDRGLRPDVHASPEAAYEQSAALIDRYHKRGRLLYAVTPRFALSTSEAMLEVCQQLLRDYPDVRLQTHINENPDEVVEVGRLFPWAADYLAVYERYGLNGPRSVMAHNVHATPSQLERFADAKSAIAHCPSSNVALASGWFPLRPHVAAGVKCALGTDVGGGLGFGMMKEALHAYLMQRVAPDPQPLDAARLLYLSTRAGAEALGVDAETGDFQSGKSADFVYLRPPPDSVLDIVVRHARTADEALQSIFTLAGAESVRDVRVGGDSVFPMRDDDR